ncbi:MAG: NADH:flavin oxidoreductase, partial [Desulfovibrio sp.]|nr:NADH:flavin oxidoreductase [Desulfovibrio sp.]
MLLSTPLTIKNITFTNRIVMPPMATHSSQEGRINPKLCAHYAARADCGLIITEHAYVHQSGMADSKQISVADDIVLPGLQQLANAVHAQGSAKLFMQINHAGSQTNPEITGTSLLSASSLPHPVLPHGSIPNALSVYQIHELEHCFAEAAKRVQQANFDGVEIHSAHGYLLNQFYSPLTNKRDDNYSATTMENRLRFLLEIIDLVRQKVGTVFPIAVRLGGVDYMEGGSSIEDCVLASQILAEAGVDLLDLSGGMCRYTRPGHKETGWFQDM